MTTRPRSIYVPSYYKAVRFDSRPVFSSRQGNDSELVNSNIDSTSSFKYDPVDAPLKSTQQLNVDWSKFENHCFFSSAEVKVNEAFNNIINGYPFDGSKKEVEDFLEKLTGFERYVYDRFPRWSGALQFSGTQVNEDPSNGYNPHLGTWIGVKDKSGVLYPSIAKNSQGEVVINPQDPRSSFTIEALVRPAKYANDTQVVFQKSTVPSMGLTFYLEPTISNDKVVGVFTVTSGAYRNSVSGTLTKGVYNHVCMSLNKKDFREDCLQFFVNESLTQTSKNFINFQKLDIDNADFLIGSGSSFYDGPTLINPAQTYSGSIDELRLFHDVRDIATQVLYSTRGLYATPSLKLYYRFNEPSGTFSSSPTTSAIILDSSGNSLHAYINNFNEALHLNAGVDPQNILINESEDFKVVLFPSHPDVQSFNLQLLTSALNYDKANPNNIIKLIPQHYLLEGAAQDGFSSPEGSGGAPYGGDGIPGQGVKGSVQIILTFLYVWAKFFDEIKVYIDSYKNLRTVTYENYDTVPDNFLEDILKDYGLHLPKFFTHTTTEQFVEGAYVDGFDNIGSPLKKIQSLLLRRTMVNLKDILKSKGTQHSIKSFLRTIGIDPDVNMRVREYGGPTTKQLTTIRETRREPFAFIDMQPNALIITTPLSSSRVEPGFPDPNGTFVYSVAPSVRVGTTSPSDGLFTSGSWNVEAVYKIPQQKLSTIADQHGRQSLLRIFNTGSAAGFDPALIVNVIATPATKYPQVPAKVQAFLRPGIDASAPLLTLTVPLSGSGIFDGDTWNVALGRARNDSFGSEVSSSYYLRIAKTDDGSIIEEYTTQQYFDEIAGTTPTNVFQSYGASYNASGSYIAIGGGQSIPVSIAYKHLNDTLNVDDIARVTDYAGWVSHLKFWSKDMSIQEWKEHVRNPSSWGVADPKKNYNFVKNVSGSFEKLRLDTLTKQPQRIADSLGNIEFLDFTQTRMAVSGTGFTSGTEVVVGDIFSYSHLATKFDEVSTDDKIRVRSFSEKTNLDENPWAVPVPSYSSELMFLSEEPQDDLRLSIEFSLVDSLDKDIVNMFASYDVMNDALGRPELMFSPDYPDLEILQDVYFNRFSDKMDFRKFMEFYRWFDGTISTFIDQLIPSKTRFKGANFVVESHMLERHKNIYRHDGNYVGMKQTIDDSLLLQQIVGSFRKY
ncbi:MAG: hypothetical protein EBR82_00385 [Caulobacteraceae bacterium]|nr:hypothetical protein [Caulobacteraceae bacterium]